jgi:arylsulfatase A-like enzyme
VLDEFRKSAVTFSNAHCPSPDCCPSRASFFTGLYPSEHGVWNNVNVPNALSRGLRPNVRPWSVDLAASGYRLSFSGKWHVSNYQMPDEFGWTSIYPAGNRGPKNRDLAEQDRLITANGWAQLKRVGTMGPANGQRQPGQIIRPGYGPYTHYGVKENPFGDQAVVDRAIEMIATAKGDQPWMLYTGTLGPHDPYMPPARFLEMYKDVPIELPKSFADTMQDKPALYRRTRDRFSQLSADEHREAIRHYLAFCSYEDYLFGQLLEGLKKSGQYDNTIILYLSDHGDYAGEHGLWTKGLPSFRSAYHVPLVISHPQTPAAMKGTISDAFVEMVDFAPTILEWTGAKSATRFSGRSLAPLLRGQRPPDWRDAVCFQSNGNETYGIQRSIQTDQWKLVYNAFDYDELYDLKNDPQQLVNLAADKAHADVVKQLYRRLWQFAEAHGDQLTDGYITTAMATYGPALAWLDG